MQARSFQKQFAKYGRETIGGFRGRPTGCYTLLLLIALMGLLALHPILVAFLLTFRLNGLLPILNTFVAVLYGWVFASLGVCLLLYLWLKFKPIAIVVTLAVVVLWAAGLRRYGQGAGFAPLLSLLTGGVVLLAGLYVASGFLLPLPGKRHRRKVFRFLLDHLRRANRPVHVVVDAAKGDKVKERIPGNPFGFRARGPGIVMSDCNHAVAISDGHKFKGVWEPGVSFTGFADQVKQAIDLRPQLRAVDLEALTKDGIEVKVTAFAVFRVDANGRPPRLGEYLPFSKSAAFKAIHAQKVEHEGMGQIPERMRERTWDDLPSLMATRILQNIISEHNFDDLYGPYQAGGRPPRRIIAETYHGQLAEQLRPVGIHLIAGGIGNLEPADPQVYVERVQNWQAEWTRRIMLEQAKGQAQRLGIVERARAETQADLILSLGRQLEELSVARAELRPETVLNQFLTVLEELMMQPKLRGLLPRGTKRALEDMRQAFPE
jgi:regulator of protease activity HflC (stomatin/prohibitin superfamily)